MIKIIKHFVSKHYESEHTKVESEGNWHEMVPAMALVLALEVLSYFCEELGPVR